MHTLFNKKKNKDTSSSPKPGCDLSENDGKAKGRHALRARRILIAFSAVLIALFALAFGAFYTGVLSPTNAAAKYNIFDYISESEVSDYVMTYKEQMGYGNTSDEGWATFLAQNNLTPERLRISTINELIGNKTIEQKAASLGITASDEEIQESIDTLKNSYSLGSEQNWQDTLEAYGQTEAGLWDTYRLAVLKRKLQSQEVPTPTPSTDEIHQYLKTYVQNYAGLTTRHSYCLKITKADTNNLKIAQQARKILLTTGLSVENFSSAVQVYCTDDDLKSRGGANGWDLDNNDYSIDYANKLEGAPEGYLSDVFGDDENYQFFWVDEAYTFPKKTEKLAQLDLTKLPESLQEYLSDLTAYYLWEQDAATYITDLINAANPVYFPMPSDVPYNVDMSLAQQTDEEDKATQ